MILALIGDPHGNLDGLLELVERAAKAGAGAALALGDIGFNEAVLGHGRPLPHFPIPVLAPDGNHDDQAFLRRAQASQLTTTWAQHGLCFQARGSVLRFAGQHIGFVGGAWHVDRPQGPENSISQQDVAVAIAAFRRHRPSILATHSCPCRIGIGMQGSQRLTLQANQYLVAAGLDCGPTDDLGESALLELWQQLPVKPKLWAFGHFHRPHYRRLGDTDFCCLPDISHAHAMRYWDMDTQTLLPLEPSE